MPPKIANALLMAHPPQLLPSKSPESEAQFDFRRFFELSGQLRTGKCLDH